MDKQDLMEYQKLKREQMLLFRRIKALQAKDVPIVAGKVKASSREFPYTEHRVSVQMHEPVEIARINRMMQIYKERQKKVEQQMLEIEIFIDSIEDAEMRQIADAVNRDLSGIGKKVNSFLQLSKNSKKSVL